MKPITFTLFLFAAFLLFSNPLRAQNQVIVTVNISPPYSHRFADYTQYRTQVFLTLTNTTQQDLQMKVLGELTGQGTGFYLKTRPDYVPNQIITLSPGETRQFRGNEVTGYFDRNNTEDNIPGPVQTEILRTGLLPQDVYEYCIEVVDINTMAVLGRRCTTIPIQYLSPPQPNLPWCGETQNIQTNPIINFSWTPAVGGALANANLRYDFYLLPVPEGQDPAQLLDLAMDGQLTAFKVQDIASTGFQYNNLDELKVGQYVWGVKARDINGQVGIENDGKSQFCLLTIRKGPNITQPNNGNNFNGNANQIADCSCKSPAQPPAGPSANELLQPGVDVKVGAYTMRVRTVDANGNGDGRISLPGFPGGITLPIKVDFKGLEIDGQKNMMTGLVTAQVKADVGFLPEITNPQLATLPLGASEIGQLDQYFSQNADQLMSNARNMVSEAGFQLPLGLDASELIVAITGLRFDATHAVLDAAVVVNITDAGTKIALSGRNICLKDGMGLCGEAELYLAENLEIPAINMGLRGLNQAQNANECTRVIFDSKGFKKLCIQAFYHFPEQTIVKAQGGGQAEARLTAETTTGWSDWIASVDMDAFRIVGVNDFMFSPGKASYDHSSKTNVANMPADYPEGQSPTWTGLFIEKVTVELPPIIQQQNNNQPLSGIAQNIIIDGNGLTGEVGLTNILKIGEGGNGNWQFSVDNFLVKFLKNTFVSGGFNGNLLLPITSRGEQSQLLYSSLLSYSNSQFAYQFTIAPKEDLEVDLFAALFKLYPNSSIMISYSAGPGFVASAKLSGELSIGGKFINDLPRIQIAEVRFQNLGLTTSYPYYTPGQLDASLGSPAKSVGGFPFNVTKWELVAIGLKATVDMQLSDHVGFLPNAKTTFTLKGRFDGTTPKFDGFVMNKISLDADFSILHIKGDLDFFAKDVNWGDGFQGTVSAVFPPGFKVESRIQIGDKAGLDYWYVDGKSDFNGSGADFTAGMNAFGFSGGICYNMAMVKFKREDNITETKIPEGESLGSCPSGIGYKTQQGTFAMKASLVFGLSAKELFNVNGEIGVTFRNGGIDKFMVGGDARMFGDPGSGGMVKGGFSLEYDFPQKIMALHIDMNFNMAIITGGGSLDAYSNGNNGDWNLKFGRPEDYGKPCFLGFNMPGVPLKITAKGYFQTGNYEVDGLPRVLPELMMRIFPDYTARYASTDRSRTRNGDAILLGLSLEASFHQNYLIFYGEIKGAFGFDLLLQKAQGGCNGNPSIGMNGWYGSGDFYAGLMAGIGIEVDLLFISGKFEILAIGFGGLLKGGGPEPTWMKGEVGGFYSILGGLIEGNCSFSFSVGDVCIPENDPLKSLKVINEVTPKPDEKGQVSELQDIFTEPAATVNLRLGKEFFLDEMINVNNEPVSKPRLFSFDKKNLTVSMKGPKGEIDVELEYDPDGFGLIVSPRKLLEPQTNYTVTFTANVMECPTESITTYSQKGIAEKGYGILRDGTCVTGRWEPAKFFDKSKQKTVNFSDVRTVNFTTNNGLTRLLPDMIVYSLPHHGQRFYCYQDFTQQAILALVEDKERAVTANSFERPDRSIPCHLKLRLVPSGAESSALDAFEVEVKEGGIYDPTLDQGAFGASQYYATKAQNYWIAPLLRGLNQNTTYGAQFFLEWDAPPASNTANENRIATVIKTRTVANGMAVISERELNIKKYRLNSNQREVYRYYFRAGEYRSIEQKIKDLKCNELVFKQLTPGQNLPIAHQILAPASQNWATVAQNLKDFYPPEVLQPVQQKAGPNGIYLNKAGYDGPEKFDIFDVYGYEKTVKNKRYKINSLIGLDNDRLDLWWIQQFEQMRDTLLKNGIREAAFHLPGNGKAGWQFTAPSIKINYVMDSITMNGALGNSNAAMQTLNYGSNIGFVSQQPQKGNNLYAQSITQNSKHLLEVRRDLQRQMGTVPGAIPAGNQWINNVMNGGWIDLPGPILQNQLMSNIGAAYDHIGALNGPGFNVQNVGSNVGGIKINAMQAPGAPAPAAINIGGN